MHYTKTAYTFNYNRIALLLSVLIACIGCAKTGPSAVSGTTRDKTNQNPVPHAAVAVLERPAEILNTNPWSILTTSQSNVDGNYYMGFTAKKGYDYRVEAQKDGFIDDGHAYNDISAGQKNKKTDIPMSPCGYLKLHVKNTTPFDNEDLINVYICSYYSVKGKK